MSGDIKIGGAPTSIYNPNAPVIKFDTSKMLLPVSLKETKASGAKTKVEKPKTKMASLRTVDMDDPKAKAVQEYKLFDKSGKRHVTVSGVLGGKHDGEIAVTLPNGKLDYLPFNQGSKEQIIKMISTPGNKFYVPPQKRITDTPAPVIKDRTFIKVGKDTFLSYAGTKIDGQLHQVLIGVTKNGIFYMKDANDKITLMPKAISDTHARRLAIAAIKRENSSVVAIITEIPKKT